MIDLRPSILLGLVLTAVAAVASAQTDDPALRKNHLTFSGGLVVSGGYAIGDRNAALRQNASGAPAPFTFFRADSAFERATGVEARVGFALTRAFAVEVGATYATPRLTVTISGDSEAGETALITEDVSQYMVEVSGVYQVPGVKLGPRVRPYVIAGAGYLRQLHQDRLLVETGGTYHVGGGVRYWLHGGAASRGSLGVRADTRFVHRNGGVDFEDQGRNYPAFSLLAFAGF